MQFVGQCLKPHSNANAASGLLGSRNADLSSIGSGSAIDQQQLEGPVAVGGGGGAGGGTGGGAEKRMGTARVVAVEELQT
jgi:hypothetical protein